VRKLEIILGTGTIYYVIADGVRVGELSKDNGKWRYHYTSSWENLPRAQEQEFWQQVNDKINVLNITSRLLR